VAKGAATSRSHVARTRFESRLSPPLILLSLFLSSALVFSYFARSSFWRATSFRLPSFGHVGPLSEVLPSSPLPSPS